MRDWKGNEVQVGDTVYIVKTISHEVSSKLVLMDLSKPFEDAPVLSEYHKPREENLWTPTSPIKIIEEGPFNLNSNSREFPISLFHFDCMFSLEDGDIICIEGKSFDRDEYY